MTTLSGSEKQIKWATELQPQIAAAVENCQRPSWVSPRAFVAAGLDPEQTWAEARSEAARRVREATQAAWVIDRRNVAKGGIGTADFVVAVLRSLHPEIK